MMASLMVFTFTLFAFLTHSLAQPGPTSACLAACLNTTTHPCTHESLAALMNCITTECRAESNDISLTYTPKAQYSCQQSFVPGSNNNDSPALQLHGNGECVTSPYDFSSFIASSESMREVAERCHMILYEREHCVGGETRMEMRDMEDGACAFQGGRSARLRCGSQLDSQWDTSALLGSIFHRCHNSTSPSGNSTAPKPSGAPQPSTTPKPSTAPKSSTGPKPSSTANGTTTSSPTHSPYPGNPPAPPMTGLATNDRPSSPSVAALVALIVIALAML